MLGTILAVVGCYCADKDMCVMLSQYVFNCAFFEDYDAGERQFRAWQRLAESSTVSEPASKPATVPSDEHLCTS